MDAIEVAALGVGCVVGARGWYSVQSVWASGGLAWSASTWLGRHPLARRTRLSTTGREILQQPEGSGREGDLHCTRQWLELGSPHHLGR